MPKEASEKVAKVKKSGKKEKDPDAPKRPLSAYMFFSKDNREKVKSENPDVSFGELGKLLGQRWKTLSEAQKKPYEDMAKADKARHESEKAAYGAK